MQQKQGLRQGTRYFTPVVSLEMNFGLRISLDSLKLPSKQSQILSILLLTGLPSDLNLISLLLFFTFFLLY